VSQKVNLLIRILLNDGKRTYSQPVYAANSRLRPHFAIVQGQPEHHPEGVYYLRYTVHDTRKWLNVGTDPRAALAAVARHKHLLQGLSLGIQSPELAPPAPVPEADPARLRWDVCVHEYMLEIEARRGRKTAVSYRQALEEFAATSPVTYLDEITRTHILALEAAIRRKGLEATFDCGAGWPNPAPYFA
jgi:hypothetical protein